MSSQYTNNAFYVAFCVLHLVLLTPSIVFSQQTEVVYKRYENTYLRNHVIRKVRAASQTDCGFHCARQKGCMSVNLYKMGKNEEQFCELNNATLKGKERSDVVESAGVLYFDVIRRFPEPEETPQEIQNPQSLPPAQSCKDVFSSGRASGDRAYNLNLNPISSVLTPVYCHMSNIPNCGGGGWTLVMKIDGGKTTFGHDEALWTNMDTYQETQGLDGLTTRIETKQPTYWQTSFHHICLGMKVGGNTRWLKLTHTASSLYDLIKPGVLVPTTVGRSAWKSLIGDESSLQPNCNSEGFNVIRARIGINSNQENDCHSCDSWIGFGASQGICGRSFSCGNVACANSDNGDKAIQAFGFIYVQ